MDRSRLIDPDDDVVRAIERRAGVADQGLYERRLSAIERYLALRGVEIRNDGDTEGQATVLDVLGGGFAGLAGGVASLAIPVFDVASSGTSDTASTTDTVTYSVAETLAIDLPAGTWSTLLIAFLDLNHSAAGTANMKITHGGSDVTSGGHNCPSGANTFKVAKRAGVVAGIAGAALYEATIAFKSSTAGTTSASNPLLFAVSWRTG